MNKITKILSVVLLSLTLGFGAQAQKIAYINSAELLADLPEVKQAKTNLETLTAQLKKKLEAQIKSLQTKAQSLQKEYERGDLSPKEAEIKKAELTKEQENLAKMEQNMAQQVADKEQTLLQPILDKVNKIIADVAKDNGYSYVMDLSSGVLLYYDESNDITALVKAKL